MCWNHVKDWGFPFFVMDSIVFMVLCFSLLEENESFFFFQFSSCLSLVLCYVFIIFVLYSVNRSNVLVLLLLS